MEEQLWIHRDSLAEAANSEHTDIKDIGLMHKHQPNIFIVFYIIPDFSLLSAMSLFSGFAG